MALRKELAACWTVESGYPLRDEMALWDSRTTGKKVPLCDGRYFLQVPYEWSPGKRLLDGLGIAQKAEPVGVSFSGSSLTGFGEGVCSGGEKYNPWTPWDLLSKDFLVSRS